ncbi:MAG: hypothetical protein M0R33_23920 [Methylomonas sp.]|jgi:tyrosyl-tRNA synthetase|uniref:hypothetical protein n=1 Tax=Methylomonas sp. TaxID=418 RepID=UPI0025DB6EF1|nr:hypothetical protein [Methylomonas sp.]MCK9609488.1 hypothetical protein [Methylomonas sp.]
MKVMLLILLFFPFQCYSWSLVDKFQYNNYRSCVDHKIKDVDRTKTDMNAARRAFEDDCKKAFCTTTTEVSEGELSECIANNIASCERAKDKVKRLSLEMAKIAREEQAEREREEERSKIENQNRPKYNSNPYYYIDKYINSPVPKFDYKPPADRRDYSNELNQAKSIVSIYCDESFIHSCKKTKYKDKTCR